MANLDLSKYGIVDVKEIVHNPSYDVLFAEETKPSLEGFEKGQVTTMLKDMDFGVYGKGIDGYIHYSLAMDRIQEEEESRKALMDEFDNDEDNLDSDDLDSDDFASDDFGSDDFGGDDF